MSNGTSTTDSTTSRQTGGTTTAAERTLTHLARVEERIDSNALQNALDFFPQDGELGEQILALLGLDTDTVEPWESSLWHLISDYGELRLRVGVLLGAEVAERLAVGRPDLKSHHIGHIAQVLRSTLDAQRAEQTENRRSAVNLAEHPRWCVTDHDEDTKYGLEKDAGHYSSDRIVGDPRVPDEAVRVCLRSWTGEESTEPARVEVGQPGTDGPALSPADARRLAGLLLIAADDADGILR